MAGCVLIVEDDEDLRDNLALLLDLRGYNVETARHGQDALDKIDDIGPPCLVVLDLMMPVMDGWEFRRAMEKDPKLSGIPVVLLSADNALAQKACAMHVQGYLTKPFELDQLLTTVERYAETA